MYSGPSTLPAIDCARRAGIDSGLGGAIVDDPHPGRDGLLEVRYFEVLVSVLSPSP